jgi:uncharacterized membrane protein YedE/YeeE
MENQRGIGKLQDVLMRQQLLIIIIGLSYNFQTWWMIKFSNPWPNINLLPERFPILYFFKNPSCLWWGKKIKNWLNREKHKKITEKTKTVKKTN